MWNNPVSLQKVFGDIWNSFKINMEILVTFSCLYHIIFLTSECAAIRVQLVVSPYLFVLLLHLLSKFSSFQPGTECFSSRPAEHKRCFEAPNHHSAVWFAWGGFRLLQVHGFVMLPGCSSLGNVVIRFRCHMFGAVVWLYKNCLLNWASLQSLEFKSSLVSSTWYYLAVIPSWLLSSVYLGSHESQQWA